MGRRNGTDLAQLLLEAVNGSVESGVADATSDLARTVSRGAIAPNTTSTPGSTDSKYNDLLSRAKQSGGSIESTADLLKHIFSKK